MFWLVTPTKDQLEQLQSPDMSMSSRTKAGKNAEGVYPPVETKQSNDKVELWARGSYRPRLQPWSKTITQHPAAKPGLKQVRGVRTHRKPLQCGARFAQSWSSACSGCEKQQFWIRGTWNIYVRSNTSPSHTLNPKMESESASRHGLDFGP